MHSENSADAADSIQEVVHATDAENNLILPEAHGQPSHSNHSRFSPSDPIISRFRAALGRIQSSELDRLYGRLPELDAASRDAIRHFADCVVAKMINTPLVSLREESENGSASDLRDALQQLFHLE